MFKSALGEIHFRYEAVNSASGTEHGSYIVEGNWVHILNDAGELCQSFAPGEISEIAVIPDE